MDSIEVRNLENQDLEALDKLYRQFWNEGSNINGMREKFSQLSDNEDYIFLIAEISGEIAGTIMGIVCYELYGECKPFIIMEDLVVHDDFRRTGIGKALVNDLEKRARERGCYQILFMTESSRKDTVAFYESLGFDSKKNIGFKRSL